MVGIGCVYMARNITIWFVFEMVSTKAENMENLTTYTRQYQRQKQQKKIYMVQVMVVVARRMIFCVTARRALDRTLNMYWFVYHIS